MKLPSFPLSAADDASTCSCVIATPPALKPGAVLLQQGKFRPSCKPCWKPVSTRCPVSTSSLSVGAALSQTGIYALQGQQALQGLRLWLEDTNEHGGLFVPELRRRVPLQLITADDRGRRTEVERLIG